MILLSNKYSLSETLRNVYSYAYTKMFFKNARFIRKPVFIRGKKSIVGGNRLTMGRYCRLDLDGKKETLYIGENCQLGDYTHIVALNKVVIGNNVLIASKVFISDTSHGSYKGLVHDNPIIAPNSRRLVKEEVIIEDNVWLGENVVILNGVVIGEGSIIGANSVVTKNIEKHSIAVGSPARVIKKYIDNEWRNVK